MNNDLLKAAQYNITQNSTFKYIALALADATGDTFDTVTASAVTDAHTDNPTVTDNGELAELAVRVLVGQL